VKMPLAAPPSWLPDAGTEPEALIREARRRQRRRYVAAGVAVGVVIAGVAAAVVNSRAGGRTPIRGHAVTTGPGRAVRPVPGLSLPGAGTTVVVWPIGYPLFTPTSGPPAYVDELSSGRHWLRQIPGIIGCDCRPYLIGVGSRLVYAGSGGATAMSAGLTGRPVVLGATQFFAPSAAQGHIWLIRYSHGYEGQGPVMASSVPVTGGPAGPAVTMPVRTVFVIAGTDAGFLLQIRLPGRLYGMALWNSGGAPVALPYSPADGITDGVGATARLVAYGSGCRVRETARDAGSTGYDRCKMLRVLNVVTGRLSSFPAPPGTAGWVPDGFNAVSAISPGNGMIAAYAVERPVEKGRARLYVVQLAGPRRRVTAVPSSAAFLSSSTAWTAAGSWLLYRGPGGHLWAYQATSGAVQASRTPFSGIVAVPSHSG
jgi:hypothetical protein